MGWAARARRRRQANYRTLTASDCRTTAQQIRKGLEFLSIALPQQASVEQMARDAEWLGSGPEEIFSATGRHDEDPRRFRHAFMRMEQARRVASLLTSVSKISGAREHVNRWIRKRIDRIETQDDQAQDHLFEIEIAGRLARWSGVEIELAEPDILVHRPGEPRATLALACKRPRTPKGAKRAVDEGRRQIEACGLAGAIIVGTEAFLHPPRDDGSPRIYLAETPDDARAEGNAIVAHLANDIRGVQFGLNVAGVLFCGVLTCWSKHPSAYSYEWIRRITPNAPVPDAAGTLHNLDSLLFDPV